MRRDEIALEPARCEGWESKIFSHSRSRTNRAPADSFERPLEQSFHGTAALARARQLRLVALLTHHSEAPEYGRRWRERASLAEPRWLPAVEAPPLLAEFSQD